MSFKDYEETGKKYGVGGSGDWMKLQAGVNKIRIVTDFSDYGVHYNPAGKKSTICIGEGCQPCAAGDKPKVQYLGWVIDRTDSKLKLLRVGWSIQKQIGELAKSEEYGFEDLPPYDITIKKTGEGLETEYAVLAARTNTELTEKEKNEIEENVTDPDEIIEKMKAKIGGGSKDKKDADEIPIIEEDGEVNIKDVPF